jgi:hypothetical protein
MVEVPAVDQQPLRTRYGCPTSGRCSCGEANPSETVDARYEPGGSRERVGIDVQKYESGANRVSASRLLQMAQAFGVSVCYFFARIQNTDASESPAEQKWREYLEQPETIKLIRFYYAIPDVRVRERFFEVRQSACAYEE